MVRIQSVIEGSIASHAGIRAGDLLISANGHAVRDVLDYRFYLTDTAVRLVLSREGEE